MFQGSYESEVMTDVTSKIANRIANQQISVVVGQCPEFKIQNLDPEFRSAIPCAQVSQQINDASLQFAKFKVRTLCISRRLLCATRGLARSCCSSSWFALLFRFALLLRFFLRFSSVRQYLLPV